VSPGREAPWRPTREQLEAATGRTVPDVLAPGLRVLFVGINPGLYSGAVGHHFARPGNRFWPTLHASGFTDRVVSPFDERDLLDLGLGVTNLVERATREAGELSSEELRAGGRRLAAKVRRARPEYVAFLGITAYRAAFGERDATIGPVDGWWAGGRDWPGAARWILPNPSGLNAHYLPADLARLFGELRSVAFGPRSEGRPRSSTAGTGEGAPPSDSGR
jgi:double-stranded uracil-DNA glycosylase